MTGATPGSITAEGEPCINSVRAANIAWWNEDIPLPLEDDTKKLFVEYSKIPEDKLEQHLLEARQKAWDSCPYPCIGQWLFLKLQLKKNQEFAEAVQRTQQGEKLLDLGCAMGHDLRDLAHAGAPTAMLYGVDIEPKFFDAGHTLFNDRAGGISFRQANVLDEDVLQEWHGQFSIVVSNYVQHCFNPEGQEKFATLILKLLSGKPNDLFFGRLGGATIETRRTILYGGQLFYRQSPTSFRNFWEPMAAKFGRKARVEAFIDKELLFGMKLPQEPGSKEFDRACNLIYAIRFE